MWDTLLTLDLGNTRLKVCAWDLADGGADVGGEPEPVARVEFRGEAVDLSERLHEWIARREGRIAAGLTSVAGEALERAVSDVLHERCDRVLATLDPGLVNACLAPERVGPDRLWAARGAIELGGASSIVVDVGTALTVDAVRASDDGGPATFLGGAIAPGPDLLASSLAAGAARLPSIQPVPGVPALGRDTEEAMRSGVAVGLRGAARELAARVRGEAGFDEAAPIVLTGGAAEFLLAPEPCFDAPVRHVANLVHLGIRSRARSALDE